MVINPYILYMKKNLTIHRLSTPSLILIAQSTAEIRHTLLLLSSFGHPVVVTLVQSLYEMCNKWRIVYSADIGYKIGH